MLVPSWFRIKLKDKLDMLKHKLKDKLDMLKHKFIGLYQSLELKSNMCFLSN